MAELPDLEAPAPPPGKKETIVQTLFSKKEKSLPDLPDMQERTPPAKGFFTLFKVTRNVEAPPKLKDRLEAQEQRAITGQPDVRDVKALHRSLRSEHRKLNVQVYFVRYS